MRRHFLRVFQRAAVGQIGRDSRRPECVITDRREDASGTGEALEAGGRLAPSDAGMLPALRQRLDAQAP
jgi:hypothetical protein